MKSHYTGGLSDFGDRELRLTSPMMRGEDVRYVQLRVGTKPDGIYGPITTRGVKNLQRSHSLPVTGIVDAATWAALKQVDPPAGSTSVNPFGSTKKDNTWLYWAGGALLAIGLGIIVAKRKKK